MSRGICHTGRTILDFADRRASCRVNPSGQSLGNVETTPIGFVRDGQKVEGFIPVGIVRKRCHVPYLKPAGAIC